jgi:Bacterial regulatory helix-turn-helix protein, lysR family
MTGEHLDWDNLRYFLAVARAGKLTAAARRLGQDHTTVGRRIASLESAFRSKLTAIIGRLRCNALKGERRHCAGWFRPRWARVSSCLLCPSGCHRFANFQSYRFIVAALSDLRSLRRPLPVRTCPPGSGRGLFVSAYVVARGAGRRHGRSRLFDGRHGLCPCRDRESRLRSSTIFEAPGPRLIKRSH